MQKSFFNKSITRIAMSLGAVGVLAMAPMQNALASSTWTGTGYSTAQLSRNFVNFAVGACAKQRKKLNTRTLHFSYVKVNKKSGPTLKAKIKYECVR